MIKSDGKRNETRGTLAQRIFEGLCDEISSGQLKPGEPLSRRRIAQRYGCSYSTVVEAMVRLEGAGLIEADSAQVARVARTSMENIQGIYVVAEALQTQAARLTCHTATAQEIKELYAEAEALDARIAVRDAKDKEVPSLHLQFHKRIGQLSRVPELVRVFDRLELLVLCQHTWLATALAMEDPPRWHSLLVDAIQSRESLAADAVMRDHWHRGLEEEILAYRMHLTG